MSERLYNTQKKQEMFARLQQRKPDEAQEIINGAHDKAAEISAPKTADTSSANTEKEFLSQLSVGSEESLSKFVSEHPEFNPALSAEAMELVRGRVEHYLRWGSTHKLEKYKRGLGVSGADFTEEEKREAMRTVLGGHLGVHAILKNILEVGSFFDMDSKVVDEFVQSQCLEDMEYSNLQLINEYLAEGGAADFKKSFEFKEAACQGLRYAVKNDFGSETIVKIIQAAYFEQDEINDIVDGLIDRLPPEDREEGALEIIRQTIRLFEDPYLAIEKVRKINNRLSELRERFPEIHSLIMSSAESLEELLEEHGNTELFLQALRENSFLVEAVKVNPKNGIKFVMHFPMFSEEVKRNIHFLYEAKANIVNDNAGINPESTDFRQKMQEKLLSGYPKNEEILNRLAEAGVNIEKWLSFGEERNFDLGNEDESGFANRLLQPINRIDETLESHFKKILVILNDFKPELKAHVTNDNSEKGELEEKLDKMRKNQSLAREIGDANRVAAIEKGVVSLEQKLVSFGDVTAWNKISGVINKRLLAYDNLKSRHSEIARIEAALESAGNRAELMQLKEELNKNKLDLIERLLSLEALVNCLGGDIEKILARVLSSERAVTMQQELTEQLTEEFEHYLADSNTIKSLLNENSDRLSGRSIKIKIASRNPDQDLYLGNHTNCCIRIDSNFHGSDSPIVDYLMDLGMHNIVAIDEMKELPIVAAWCFVGADKNGEPILVVDNIEANTDYSSMYGDQIAKEMRGQIESLAESANIKKIIQGPDNNDLVVAPLAYVEDKLGGYISAEDYYLEAVIDKDNDHIFWHHTQPGYEADDGDLYYDNGSKLPTFHEENLVEDDDVDDIFDYDNSKAAFRNRARK